MTQEPKIIAVVDPRTFEGDPYEVAERAVAQLKGLLGVVEEAVEPVKLMVRNAELERQLAREEAPDAVGWDETTEGRRWQAVEDKILGLRNELSILKRVAAFNPRAR